MRRTNPYNHPNCPRRGARGIGLRYNADLRIFKRVKCGWFCGCGRYR